MPSSKKNSLTRTVELINEAREEFAANRLEGRNAAKLAAALRYATGLEQRIKHLEDFRVPAKKAPKLTAKLKPSKSESVPVLALSDLHVEEVVDPLKVHGLNKFNPEIARASLRTVFESNVKLVKMFAEHTKIDTQVIAIAGDLITNASMPHDGIARSCAMGPAQAANYVFGLLRDGINLTLNHTKLNLHIPMVGGNHDRSTDQVIIGQESEFAWSTAVYERLAAEYADEPRVTTDIAADHVLYTDIYGYRLRTHHGHSVRGSSRSPGGLLAMLRNAARDWNTTIPADITLSGHFHSSIMTEDIVANGSLIGYSPYSLFCKFAPERPQQSLFLIEKNNGMTLRCPVWAR